MDFLKEESQTWTASHSFDQRMIFDGTDFVNLDLADAFPRGISISKKKRSKLIFTYKAGKMYQKTFTELGNLVSLPDGYLVLGAGERDFNPANAEVYLNDSRNLFLLKVAKNFSDYKSRFADAVCDKQGCCNYQAEKILLKFLLLIILARNFPQKRVGVVWLTDFKNKNKENILRPKLIQLAEDKFLALYEKWSANMYLTTEYFIFNSCWKNTT
jgi:hypothetical protein